MSIDYTTNNYGDVTNGGRTIRLTDAAYPNNYGTEGGVRYYAPGVDDDGVKHLVVWDTTDAWDSRDADCDGDESEACDWGDPVEIRETDG